MRTTTESSNLNRTGMALAPDLAAEIIEGAAGTRPTAKGSADELAKVRISYAKDAEPVGSMPPPATLLAGAKALLGEKALPVLLDKLGERLAFERSGTRLYDGLLSKFDSYGSWQGGPSREDLEHIRGEEHAHFTMLSTMIEALGGDPTAVTPSADIHAVASKGICAVISDARTNLMQSLEAILAAELVDNDCWENLIDLAHAAGRLELVDQLEDALGQEREHLDNVRQWLGAALSSNAVGGAIAPSFLERDRERRGRVRAGGEPEDSGDTATESDNDSPTMRRAASGRAPKATGAKSSPRRAASASVGRIAAKSAGAASTGQRAGGKARTTGASRGGTPKAARKGKARPGASSGSSAKPAKSVKTAKNGKPPAGRRR